MTPSSKPLARLIYLKMGELGLTKHQLVLKLGYTNFSKGHNRFNRWMAGEPCPAEKTGKLAAAGKKVYRGVGQAAPQKSLII